MDAISLIRQQVQETHEILEGTMADVTPQQAQWLPAGKATPLGAQYAHAVMGEDMFVNMLKGQAPLAASSFAGKSGLSEPHPMGEWEDWARRVKVDLSALRTYAQAVYQNTDEFLKALSPADLEREVDLTAMGLGKRTMAWALTAGGVMHAASHCGEISCLKGLQGAKGYPF